MPVFATSSIRRAGGALALSGMALAVLAILTDGGGFPVGYLAALLLVALGLVCGALELLFRGLAAAWPAARRPRRPSSSV